MQDDSNLLAERIGSLQEENKQLKDKLQKAAYDNATLSYKVVWDRWWVGISIFLVVCLCVSFIGYSIYQWIATSNIPTHCTIDGPSRDAKCSYTLYGVIDWHFDESYGTYGSLEEAKRAAKTMRCKLP
jgi:hypothetical protein